MTSYYEADGLGSVSSLSNSAGALANTYTYDSFGKLTASTGTLVNPFQYTGREFDSETGAYYYRARYYDQNVGRFLNEDPFRFGGGIDFYSYVRNSPPSLKDPYGLEPQGCTDCRGKPTQGLAAGKSCCGNETPTTPNPSQNPYPPNYFYLNVQADYMYHYGGTNPWGNIVRACLVCVYSHGVDAGAAHSFSYANASNRTSAWDTAWGYTVAIDAAMTYINQQGGVGGPLPYK